MDPQSEENIQMLAKQVADEFYDDQEEPENKLLVGSKAWLDSFNYMKINEATPQIVKTYSNGTEMMKAFNRHQCWTVPFKVINLCMEMLPNDPDFDILDVLIALGGSTTTDVIDVYSQEIVDMTFDKFYQHWVNRDRLCNIISLRFHDSDLAKIVKPPALARELCWEQRFWEKNTDDSLLSMDERPSVDERPNVEQYVLLSMAGSFTNFHIDFGGSTTWLHVLKGEKIFFIARPSDKNLKAFSEWQTNEKRRELFFGDLLPPGEFHRLHIREGETLFLPSGWIHSVYTPKDSIIFSGSFLHDLNVVMQLRIYDIETSTDTPDRFTFPSFELCNFCAAKSFARMLKESTSNKKRVELDDAQALLSKCKQWLKADKKFAVYRGAIKDLEQAIKGQLKIS